MTANTSSETRTGKYWAILLVSACLEATWATALSWSNGFTVLIPSLIFLVAGVLSMIGLAHAMKGIPVSVAYAVWTGIGAALTAAIAIITGQESVSFWKIAFLVGIVGFVVALKFAPAPKPQLEKLREAASS